MGSTGQINIFRPMYPRHNVDGVDGVLHVKLLLMPMLHVSIFFFFSSKAIFRVSPGLPDKVTNDDYE